MPKVLKVLLLSVVFSFLWGVWWSVKDQFPKIFSNEVQEIRVLAPEGIISDSLLKMAEDKKFQIRLTTKTSNYDLLREILSPVKVYDLVIYPSTLTDSMVLSNYFMESFDEKYFDEVSVSIDFRSLEFDSENRYSIPLLWTVYGWLHAEDRSDFSLMNILESERKVRFYTYPRPALIYAVMEKLFPPAHSFIQTGNKDELKSLFSRLSSSLALRKAQLPEKTESEDLWQARHTEAEAHADLKFSLPKEKADLELYLASIHKASQKKKSVLKFIKMLFDDAFVKELVEASDYATAKTSADLNLSPAHKSSAIRDLPISRLNILSVHEAYEPLFTEFLRKSFPESLKEANLESK